MGEALLTGGALTSTLVLPETFGQTAAEAAAAAPSSPLMDVSANHTPIDFRYSPVFRQTVFSFPDDPYKSVMDEKGTLLYGYDRAEKIDYFPLVIDFALGGMKEADTIEQTMESPSAPILRTRMDYPRATMLLTTFATSHPDEGRVDNVLIEVRSRGSKPVRVSPLLKIHCIEKHELKSDGQALSVTNGSTGAILLVARTFDDSNAVSPQSAPVAWPHDDIFHSTSDTEQQLIFPPGLALAAKPYRAFVRFPQEKQAAAQLEKGLNDPDGELASARQFWASWPASQRPVSWQIPGRQGEFVTACARNILQARELKDGKLTFQVGPTCYRGLWVVDGNFILEAARYLGYDKEAVEGLRTTWSKQQSNGQVVAGGGLEHYKDTAIAMFTLVRQCELSQDWSLLREYKPNVVAALDFIDALRTRSHAEGGVLGRYGLLPKGFSDGGLGVGIEVTNTLWTMAGLKAIGAAGEKQNIPEIARATRMYRDLYAGFNELPSTEMRSFDGKFQYLPMLLKEDPLWQAPNTWDRPRPQSAQWALSHTIFPGRVFDPQHPVLQGHVKLMQAVRQEGIPAETGWIHHEGVWNYNAAFAAEVYLWLGMKQAAHDTFVAFLNHASPQYCWREEQPLQDALLGSYVGDMPHNWASAECIRYMRHIMALEDGPDLRLLAGFTEGELALNRPFVLKGTPTRFGRLDLNFEPLDRNQGWRLNFNRENGPTPAVVTLPATLGSRFHLVSTKNLKLKQNGVEATADPENRAWSAMWKA